MNIRAIALALLLCLCLTACGGEPEESGGQMSLWRQQQAWMGQSIF